ncbi:MAG TPA: pentapeptide repeat-containing protein [Solirubrobacteraceae bacterium]|nr:pentapeptide repeat-containing protein [Solirubrobacteraceae bacterium]
MPAVAGSPDPPELPSELATLEVAAIEPEASFVEVELSGDSWPGLQAKDVSFKASRLANVDLSGAALERLWLSHCELSGCNLANLRATGARVQTTRIADSRMTGIAFAEATLSDVTFSACRIDLAALGFARLERVTFEDCLLAQSDFLEARLEHVRFYDCDLTGADFRGARLEVCEFRRSNLSGIEHVSGLRGASLEWPYLVELAGVWAAELGIGVLDQDEAGNEAAGPQRGER